MLFSGGLMDIGDLKNDDVAIVQGWFPGATGGTASAETVFGEQNRFGKLPFTMYNSAFTAASDFDNMNMTDGPGRTYKYLKNSSMAQFGFGFGLSYTTFDITSAMLSDDALHAETPEAAIGASVTVTNTGNVAGDEVVFLYKQSAGPMLAW